MEAKVADLVAQGLTNRQVAARLFLSPHTVDFHLRQIYRKLDIDSRVKLTRLVAEHRGSQTATLPPARSASGSSATPPASTAA